MFGWRAGAQKISAETGISLRSWMLHPTVQGRSVEVQLEAAAGGRPEGLRGVVAEAVAPQPATGRCKRERVHGRRATHTRGAKEGGC